MEKRSRRRIRDLVARPASLGLSENEIGCARISMVARNTNVPFKGRIQKRKTYHLQIITFRLQRAAGPYRMGWTGRAPAPNDSQSAWGACQEKEHPHASRIHRSRSDRYWNRSRQEHTSYDRSRFVWRPRAARAGLARTHRIEACEPATLPHWHRSRNGDTLCCS